MYFLGIDGGGTKTEAVLSSISGDQFRHAVEGPGNVSTLGRDDVKKLILNLIESVLEGESMSLIQNATFCFAGIGREQERKKMSEVIASIGLNDFSLKTDAEILHFAAFDEDDGIVLEAGTGAVCIIRSEGELKQFGGWGYLLGDTGGGYSIGRSALRSVLIEAERGDSLSEFSSQIMKLFNVDMPDELITKVYEAKSSQMLIGSCAELVSSLAKSGDQHANAIISEAAATLFDLMNHAIESTKLEVPYNIALAGSVLGSESPARAYFKELAAKSSKEFIYSDILISSAGAALLNAMKSSGESISESVQLKLKDLTL